jgi:hypothetical protein
MHGPQGPGPMAANFQGRHIKKSRLKYGMRIKKGCPREGNLREIYTENTKMFCFFSFLCCFCLHITEDEQISCAQGCKIPKYRPAYRTRSNLDQERIDVCNAELIVVGTSTSFHHNNT